MFRTLLAHLQDALHKRHFDVLRARYVSWLYQNWSVTSLPREILRNSKLH
jgi:hypothetical protein